MRNEDFMINIWPLDPLPAGATAWPRTVVHLKTYGFSRRAAIGQNVHPHLIIKGSGNFHSQAGDFRFTAGDMFCVWPGVAYEFSEDEDDPWELYAMRIEGPGNTDIARRMGFGPDNPYCRPLNTPRVKHAYCAMFNYWGRRQRDPHEGLAMFHRLIVCVHHKDNAVCGKRSNRMIFREALALIESLLEAGINVTELSGRLGVNRTELWRIFKAEAGMTVIEWIQKARIEKAKTILKQTNLKISAVAGMCGFNEEKHFLRSFRQQAGLTPTQWRRK